MFEAQPSRLPASRFCQAALLLAGMVMAPAGALAEQGWLDSLSARFDSVLRSTGLKDPYPWEIDGATPARPDVETIINDMGGPNDAVLLGISKHAWAVDKTPAQIAMGTDTRGCKAPRWWLKSSAREQFKSCEPWRAFVQWFVVFEGEGNRSARIRVQVRYPQSWYLSKTADRWIALVRNQQTSWFAASKDNVTWVDRTLDVRNGSDGSVAIMLEPDMPFTYHGIVGRGPVDISEAINDLGAVFTTVQARLVVDDPAQAGRLENAVWLFQSGADYYPAADTHPGEAVPPGVGLSRSKKLTREWQTFNFATLVNARQDYPGASRSLTLEAFRAKPPPLE